MEYNTVVKESFVVIGKEGSTRAGEGFGDKLWNKMLLEYISIREMNALKFIEFLSF